MPYVIGLTGGIGSGKSTVAAAFARHGAVIVDTDVIAHELTAPGGAAVDQVRRAFGNDYILPTGALDRARMRERVFREPDAKRRLEAILHPLIRAEADRRVLAARGPYVLLVVPLLVESGALRERYQRVLVVDCDESQQMERVQSRSGLNPDEIRRIMATQASRAERLARADDVVDNSGPANAIETPVEELHATYLKLAEAAFTRAGGLGNAGLHGGQSLEEVPHHTERAPARADAPSLIVYEYPLSERVRTLLRLENLFDRLGHFLGRSDAVEHHIALLTLFEIMEVASRADLKSDLLQELERQKQILLSFRNNPEISENVLNRVLGDIEQASSSLFAMTGRIGQYLREHEWLMSIKQRTGIPGGACEFDLPSYHYWRHRASEARLADLMAWIAPLFPIRDGTAIVLRLLREGGKPSRHVAQLGTFSQMLGGKVSQMVRIRLGEDSQYIPEISANKYALNIRFTTFGSDPRPKPAESDVEFELSFCNL